MKLTRSVPRLHANPRGGEAQRKAPWDGNRLSLGNALPVILKRVYKWYNNKGDNTMKYELRTKGRDDRVRLRRRSGDRQHRGLGGEAVRDERLERHRGRLRRGRRLATGWREPPQRRDGSQARLQRHGQGRYQRFEAPSVDNFKRTDPDALVVTLGKTYKGHFAEIPEWEVRNMIHANLDPPAGVRPPVRHATQDDTTHHAPRCTSSSSGPTPTTTRSRTGPCTARPRPGSTWRRVRSVGS
jgi:hypothetical protein